MEKSKIASGTFLGTDIERQNRQKISWFDLDGTVYGIATDIDTGEDKIVDFEGYPVDSEWAFCNTIERA